MIKTMLGETCGMCTIDKGEERFRSYLIEGECGRFWISEKELERIKLPFLRIKGQKMYDKIMDEGLTIGLTLYKNGEEYHEDLESDTQAQKILEAFIKGGYNKW